MEDFLYIDPSVINPNILKNGPGKLNKEQRQALKALLHIKRLTKDYKKGEEKENAINRLKQDIRDELNRNSSFNIEVNKVIKKFTEGLNLSKGGNRRTRSRRTRRRI
jgi:adenylyl- and sulfurtransferase ThiI